MRRAAGHITERKVTLLERWLTGLTATQGYLAQMDEKLALSRARPGYRRTAPALRKVSAALLAS